MTITKYFCGDDKLIDSLDI